MYMHVLSNFCSVTDSVLSWMAVYLR